MGGVMDRDGDLEGTTPADNLGDVHAPKPYYQDDYVTLYHGRCEDMPNVWSGVGVLVSDVPYGIDYKSNSPRDTLRRSIAGDRDTEMRDYALLIFQRNNPRGLDGAALIFGTWRVPRPVATRQVLVWDTKGALGMGAMDLPWKPSHQEIYVIGSGFRGRRTTDVIVAPPVQSLGYNGRVHPHQKPVPLMENLIAKCPDGVIGDPFSGSGSTLIAARNLGRKCVGVELDEEYCEITAKRLQQQAFDFGDIA